MKDNLYNVISQLILISIYTNCLTTLYNYIITTQLLPLATGVINLCRMGIVLKGYANIRCEAIMCSDRNEAYKSLIDNRGKLDDF